MQNIHHRKEEGVKEKNDKLLYQVKKVEKRNKKLQERINQTLLMQLAGGQNLNQLGTIPGIGGLLMGMGDESDGLSDEDDYE